jgi:hypothetical protein
MKRISIFFLLLIVAFALYWFYFRPKSHHPKGPKPVPMALKKHSDNFNATVNTIITDYLSIKDAFIDADTATVKAKTASFILALAALDTAELKKDTAMIIETVQASLNDVRSNAESLLKQTDITEMRRDFSSMTEMMYPTFFKAIKYEGPKLFLQNCPMAFNDNEPANWISNSEEVVNPYLGKAHPKYKATMLHCGEVKDTIKAQ